MSKFIFEFDITKLGLSQKSLKILKKHGIITFRDVGNLSPNNHLKMGMSKRESEKLSSAYSDAWDKIVAFVKDNFDNHFPTFK